MSIPGSLRGIAPRRTCQALKGGSSTPDTEPWFCASGQCADIVGSIEMWRDDNHITAVYAKFLGPAMSAQLAAVMPPP